MKTFRSSNLAPQISEMGDVTLNDFSLGGLVPFLLKNITDEPIECDVLLWGADKYVKTVIYSGWNVEICSAVRTVSEGLQWGR